MKRRQSEDESGVATPAENPVHLPGLLVFEFVAQHLSFTKAALALGLSTTSVSQSIRQLEEQIGLRLFNRTTRSVALTEMGARLWDSINPPLQLIRQSVADLRDAAQRPGGLLRLNVSYVAYAILIEPNLRRFAERYPDICLEISLDNRISDIIADGFDAGIRLGHALQQDMIAVALGTPQKMIVVASRDYLDRLGTPKVPEDLLKHDCIRQRLHGRSPFLEWNFKVKKRPLVIEVGGSLVVDEMRAVLDAVRRGCGLGYVFEQFALDEIRNESVVALLSEFGPEPELFYLYYANRKHMPGKLRAFIDFLRQAPGA